jgi:nucleoredoxin
MAAATVSPLTALFGPTLVTKSGSGSTDELLRGKTIGIYFSAHWCPPCRGFTPKLAEMYKSTFQAKGLEIVFASSDKDEGAFNEYYADMPWLALPYSNRELKETLSKKYKVRGIPSFVILDSDGNTITTEGRDEIMSDASGARFPWKPLSPEEKQKAILDTLGSDLRAKVNGKPFALYFSAHWCPPCRGFTPKLAEWYNAGLKDKMEVIFVSSDKDESQFKDYSASMPWLSLPYENRDGKALLSKACNCEGIPHLAVFNADGSLVTEDGRAAVTRDTKAETFPEGWMPQPFCDVEDGVDALNSEKCVVYIGSSEEQAAPLKEVASEYHLKANKVIGEMAYRFFSAKDSSITQQIRKLTSVNGSKLVMLDLDDNGAFYVHDGDVTAASVRTFIAAYENKSLERKQLQK